MTLANELLLPAFAHVNPVPWARSQMAFTLGFHIILVPLGVSWSVMTLIANYRGIKHHDSDALLLAQRWSKYMAVTFAVGAVTGTVLTFEFALLWPRFMGQWGDAFGVPIALAGILGSVSVVAANAWMNSPEGVTLNASGDIVQVDAMGVIFNEAMPLMAAHMTIAAYL